MSQSQSAFEGLGILRRSGGGRLGNTRTTSKSRSTPKALPMNTPITARPIAAVFTSLALVVSISLAVGLSVRAVDAPGKGAERLAGIPAARSVQAAVPVAVAAPSHANCPACSTVVATKPPGPARGAETLLAQGKPVSPMARHGCGGCRTSIEVTGHGKAKTEQAVHACSMPALASAKCCK